MNKHEKVAWFNLAIIILSTILFFIIFSLMKTKADYSISLQVASSAFALIAITAFGPLFFGKTGVIIDERGTVIKNKNRVYKFILFGGVLVSILFGIWIWMKFSGIKINQFSVFIMFFLIERIPRCLRRGK
jgi:hypothetical protein